MLRENIVRMIREEQTPLTVEWRYLTPRITVSEIIASCRRIVVLRKVLKTLP